MCPLVAVAQLDLSRLLNGALARTANFGRSHFHPLQHVVENTRASASAPAFTSFIRERVLPDFVRPTMSECLLGILPMLVHA